MLNIHRLKTSHLYHQFSTAATLLELMVVLAILGIAASYGIVSYKNYSVKSQFTQIFSTIEEYKDDAQAAFIDNDKFPSTFSGLTSSTYNSTTASGLQFIYYGVSSTSRSAYMYFYTTNLGVSGYVQANADGSGGTNCRVAVALVPNSTGQMQFYCGQWDSSGIDVPLSYLPSNCQTTNISALII